MLNNAGRFLRNHPLLTTYLFAGSISIVYHILIYISGMAGSVGMREAIIMNFLWLIPVMIWPQYIKRVALIVALILLPASLISFGYWLLYGQDFSQSVIFIIFESNAAESTEFLQSYLRWWHPIAFLAYFAVPIYLWRQLRPFTLTKQQKYAGITAIFVLLTWPFTESIIKQEGLEKAIEHQVNRTEPAAPWSLAMGYYKYREVLADMQDILNDNTKLPPLTNLELDEDKLPDRLVLVLGESTNRQRMSLYGYSRPTSPKLESIRSKLTIFNDVIGPRPYTIEAMQQILSFADQTHPDDFFTTPNLLNILKQAGYYTTWITNQQTQTERNTLLTSLAEMADEQIFLNNNRDQNADQYDDIVLKPYLHALNEPHKRQAIIVHLLGTHRKYDSRYPEEYQVFNDKSGVPDWITDDILEEYNSYDNAVLFNDHVMYELITELDKKDDNSLLVYFSDHGEEVYDQAEDLFSGRNESAPRATMYTVPFFIWQSEKAPQRDLNRYVNRPYQTSDFIHTLVDLMGITFDRWDPTRSLVNPQFVTRERLIGDPHGKKLTSFEELELNRTKRLASDESAMVSDQPL